MIRGEIQTTQTVNLPLNATQYCTTLDMAGKRHLSIEATWAAIAAAAAAAFGAVTIAADTITYAAHGWYTGTLGQMSTSGGLPAGLATSTNYYIIRVDANTVKFATSYANALAGTAIDLTTQGTGNHTFTPTTTLNAGTVKIQRSIDGTNWYDVPTAEAANQTIAAAGGFLWELKDCASRYYRVAAVLSAVQGLFNVRAVTSE